MLSPHSAPMSPSLFAPADHLRGKRSDSDVAGSDKRSDSDFCGKTSDWDVDCKRSLSDSDHVVGQRVTDVVVGQRVAERVTEGRAPGRIVRAPHGGCVTGLGAGGGPGGSDTSEGARLWERRTAPLPGERASPSPHRAYSCPPHSLARRRGRRTRAGSSGLRSSSARCATRKPRCGRAGAWHKTGRGKVKGCGRSVSEIDSDRDRLGPRSTRTEIDSDRSTRNDLLGMIDSDRLTRSGTERLRWMNSDRWSGYVDSNASNQMD